MAWGLGLNATITLTDGITPMIARLDNVTKERVLRQALRAAAKPIIEAAKGLAPVRTGMLRKSLGVRIRDYITRLTAVIGPKSSMVKVVGKTRQGTPRNIRPANYAHLVELGTAAHSLTESANIDSEMRSQLRRAYPSPGEWKEPAREIRASIRESYLQKAISKGQRTHPGAKPKPFLGPAVAEWGPMARDIIAGVINHEVHRLFPSATKGQAA